MTSARLLRARRARFLELDRRDCCVIGERDIEVGRLDVTALAPSACRRASLRRGIVDVAFTRRAGGK